MANHSQSNKDLLKELEALKHENQSLKTALNELGEINNVAAPRILVPSQDITENKLAENALIESEKLFKAMFSTHAAIMLLIEQAGGKIIAANHSAEIFYGYPAAKLCLMNVSDINILPPDQINKIMMDAKNSVNNCFVVPHRLANGQIRTVEISSSPISNNKDPILFAIIHDITDRKIAEVSLIVNEHKYRSLFENMDEGFALHEIIIDERGCPVDFRFLEMNTAFERHTGLSAKESIGKTILEILPRADTRQIENYGKVALTGEPLQFEYYSKAFKRHLHVRAFCPQRGRFATIFEDISERKSIDEKLKESEAKYRMIFENCDEAILLTDPDGPIYSANPAACRIFGRSEEELCQIGRTGIVDSSDPRLAKAIAEREKTGKYSGELNYLRKDGTVFPGELSSTIFFDSHGNKRTSLIIRDISERKRAEEELRKLNLQLISIMENTGDVIAMMDTEYRYILFNSAAQKEFRKIFGKDLKNGDSMPQALADVPEDLDNAMKYWKRALAGEDFTVTQLFGNTELERDWYELHFSPIRNNEGKVVAAVHIVRNASERKQMEETLSNERRLLRTIIDSIPVAVFVKDIEGRKVIANLTEVQLSGKNSEDEILGQTDFDLYLENEAKRYYGADQTVLQSGKPILNIEDRLIDKEGQIHWMLGSKIPLKNAQGQITGIVGLNHDITERKMAEEEVKKSNMELKKSHSEKDKFFSIIAHDLRSPFTGLLGLTELMTSEKQKLTLEEYRQYSQALRTSVINLYKLIENLLEWAMLQQGSIGFIPEELNLSDIFSQCIDSINERARQKGISVFCESGSVKIIYADEKMINTVLRNLISNAVKFTERGGKVTVKAKDTVDGMTEISVSDTGVGIPDDVIDKLFILGEQIGTTGTDNEPSTGLGLILCKEFVEKHNGKIWVESKKGTGSTFYFTIPKII